jgi:hypothetical protein
LKDLLFWNVLEGGARAYHGLRGHYPNLKPREKNMSDDHDQVSAALSDATAAAILGHIAAIEQLLPFLLARQAGGQSVMADTPPSPEGISLAEVLQDRTAGAQFQKFLPPLRQLMNKMENTFDVIMLVESAPAPDKSAPVTPKAEYLHEDRLRHAGHARKEKVSLGKISHIANVRYPASVGNATPITFRQAILK